MDNNSVSVRAAIDIGSNTIHIVVARATAVSLEILADEEEMVRIGESVNATGSISPEKQELTIATLHRYQSLAQHHGVVGPMLVVATEAIRQAKNSREFIADVLQATGLEVHLIEGNAEATLTFFGATYELLQKPDPPDDIAVLDLGGGSMELVTAHKQAISWRTSVPIGSGWLHDRYLPSDPPSADDLEVAGAFLRTYFAEMPIKKIPPLLIATGGSANSLWYLLQQAFSEQVQPWRLSLDLLAHCEELLTSLSAEQVAERYHQSVKRTKVLPAGLLIIQTLMTQLGLSEIRVSSHGIREGALLAYARYGEDWLERVSSANGIVEEQDLSSLTQTSHGDSDFADEAFSQTGKRLVLDRLRKMLDWRSDVLKHEDIEAVHKMRVASRRLRAVLDAYEVIGNAKKFKKVYSLIKDIADMLGKARDTDVMLEALSIRLEQVELDEQVGLRWLIARLQVYRQQHQLLLEKFLIDLNDEKVTQQIKDFLSAGGA
jgi:exopolyphosphatase/pppGpp-phosphohydrolase